MTSPVPVERKCKLEEVFDANFIELIRLVPRNPLVMASILKLAGKMPGQEYQTFEQFKEWVETNCEKKARPPKGTGRHITDDGIAVSVDFSETEYGRADYSVRRSGSGQFRIGAGDLMEMVQEAINDGEGLDRIVEVIAGKIEDDAWTECEPSLEDYGDHDYSDHDVTDTTDSETDFSRNTIRTAVLAFVRERHPELAAEL